MFKSFKYLGHGVYGCKLDETFASNEHNNIKPSMYCFQAQRQNRKHYKCYFTNWIEFQGRGSNSEVLLTYLT